MKKSKNILLLSGVLLLLIFAWLIPKTKGEKKTRYVRVYTEEKDVAVEKDSAKTTVFPAATGKAINAEEKKTRKQRVVIQKDTLNGRLRMKDLKMSLYSRSAHFVPEHLEVPPASEPVSLQGSADSSSARLDSLEAGH